MLQYRWKGKICIAFDLLIQLIFLYGFYLHDFTYRDKIRFSLFVYLKIKRGSQGWVIVLFYDKRGDENSVVDLNISTTQRLVDDPFFSVWHVDSHGCVCWEGYVHWFAL